MKWLTNYIIKKFIFIFLLSFLWTTTAKSQNAAVYFQETYSYNDTFVAAIYLDSFSQLGSVTMSLQFDNNALEIIEINGANIGGSFAQNVLQDTIYLGWFSLSPLTTPDTFATIKLLKKQEFCNTPLDWTGVLQLTDNVGITLSSNFYNGKAYYLKDEKPTLVYPNINDPTVPVNSIFRWNDYNIECESGYHLQVASDSFFTQMIVDTVITDSAFAVVGLQELTNNYWRVAKVDELQNEYWSDFRSFYTITTDTLKANIPTLINWSDTLCIPVTFTNSENIGLFDLDIDYDTTTFTYLGYENLLNNPTNIQVIDTSNGIINLNWQTSNLPTVIPSDTFIVLKFVQSTGCIGDISFNPSSAFYFVENVPIPSTYVNGQVTFADSIYSSLVLPLNNSADVFIRPTLTWNDIHCSNAYQVQVASDSMFTNLFADTLVADTTFVPTNLSGDSTYYWRVGRYNILDSLYWTGFWSFTTESVLKVNLEVTDLITELDTFLIPVIIDSLANSIAFQLHLNYDTTAIKFLGFTDTTLLISNMNTTADSGTVKIYWESIDSTLASVANIFSDTLVQLQFEYLSSCETDLVWAIDTSDFYHINDNINIDADFKNSHLVFLKTEYPTQLLPIDGALTSMYPDFRWQNMDCVENFHFQISSDDQFTQIVVDSILNDTTFWATSLQANTSYFWRVAKEDFAGNLFWSDTLSLTTADFYTSKLELDSVLTYQSIAEVALTIDSVFFLNGFQIELTYDNAVINYSGSVDSLFPNIQITDNNGILTLNWQDTLWHHAVNDTLIVLQFLNTGACKTPVDFSNVSFNYRGNAFFNNTITTKNGSIEYLNTVSPILIAPFDNQTDVYPVTAFVWSSVDCSVEYQLQVSESSDFSNIVLDTILQNAAFDNLILNHNSTYYWRVGRWDTQADRYWSNTLTFQTEVLPTVQVEVANIITYNDTMRVAISIDSLIWAENFDLVVEYDTIGFEYTGFSDTLFDMFVNEQNGAIMVQWMADSSSLQHWLNIDADTLVYLHFKNKNGCYTDLEWNSTATSFRYKSPNISIDNNNINGSIEWVNDDAPTLVFPPNDTLFLSTSFELSWNDVNCAESFAIQIATDSTFEDIVVEATNLIDLTYTAMNLERYTKYYWRVGQIDSEDTLHWSAIQNFQTDIENENDHWIFPNPTTDILNVWLNDESESSAEITIYNSIGQLMWTYSVDRVGKRVQLDLKPLDRGIYMIQFDDGVNKWVEKVVVY